MGLVDQQIANDPGGDRWIRLIDEVVAMFLAHCASDRIDLSSTRQRRAEPTSRELPCLKSLSPACTT